MNTDVTRQSALPARAPDPFFSGRALIQVYERSCEKIFVAGLFDEKFKTRKGRYLLQCALATISAMIALIVLDAIANAAIIGALGASAFVVFTMPQRHVSDARFLIGGYLVGIVAGTLCHWLSQLLLLSRISGVDEPTSIVFFAALAVGLAIFLMVVTNTEHPPAAGLAMGLVLNEWSPQLILVVLLGIAYLAGMKRLLRRVLIDLL